MRGSQVSVTVSKKRQNVCSVRTTGTCSVLSYDNTARLQCSTTHTISKRASYFLPLSLSTVPETVRLENLQIVELWLSRETIPPEETLDPQNGKFSVVIRTMRYSYGRLTVLFGVQDQTYFTKID